MKQEHNDYSSCCSHCADLILSFSIKAVLPGLVGGPLGDFLVKWVATTSPLMEVIGSTMTKQYVDRANPVFSSRHFGHFTLVSPSPTKIGGKMVVCPNECSGMLRTSSKSTKSSQRWTLTCNQCRFRAKYSLPGDDVIEEVDQGNIMPIPGQKYLRTKYPIPMKVLKWAPVEPQTSSSTTSFATGDLPRAGDPWGLRPSPSMSTSTSPSPSPSPSARVSPPITPSPTILEVEELSPLPGPSPLGPVDQMAALLSPVDLGPMIPRSRPQGQASKRVRNDLREEGPPQKKQVQPAEGGKSPGPVSISAFMETQSNDPVGALHMIFVADLKEVLLNNGTNNRRLYVFSLFSCLESTTPSSFLSCLKGSNRKTAPNLPPTTYVVCPPDRHSESCKGTVSTLCHIAEASFGPCSWNRNLAAVSYQLDG